MGGLKRFFILVMALLTLALTIIGALLLTNFSNLGAVIVRSATYGSWQFITLAVLLGLVALGALIMLGIGIFARGKLHTLTEECENGTIEISRVALESAARNAIEAEGTYVIDDVRVKIINGSTPSMFARATLGVENEQNLAELGSRLQEKIKQSLENFSGYVVSGVDVEFFDISERVQPSGAGE